MFVAIMATIIPMFERMTENRLRSIEAYLYTKLILSMFKSAMMMTVFVVNGLANDFFIGFTFLFTTIIGLIYFIFNPFYDPYINHDLDKKSGIGRYTLKLFFIVMDY